MNNYWTYWQIFSVLKRFFLSRWWDILADDEAIWSYLNLAMQDLYNTDSAIFRHVVEDIVWVVEWEFTKFTTQLPIHKIQKCYRYSDSWELISDEEKRLIPRFTLTKAKNECVFSWKEITTFKEIKKIRVIYLRDFIPVTSVNKWDLCEIPFRYIPWLIKLAYDWWSPINLMSWESSTTDFFSHWMNRIDKINKDDWLTDYMEVNPYTT